MTHNPFLFKNFFIVIVRHSRDMEPQGQKFVPRKTQLETDIELFKKTHNVEMKALSTEKVYTFSAKMMGLFTTISQLQNEILKLQKEFDDLFFQESSL